MKPGVVLTVLSIATAIVAQLRFLPSEAGEVSASNVDGGVMSISAVAHDPSARFAGLRVLAAERPKARAPSRDPRRGGIVDIRVAQKGRDARDDGAAARSDALMGTPNKKTPVPQDNRFSTSPRLEQQPPATELPVPRGATPAAPVTPR
jgi:hypothetical protein